MEITTRYAIVDPTGKVITVSLWDGTTPWTPPDGCIAIACDETVGVGDVYRGRTFIKTPVPPRRDPLRPI